MDVRSRSWGNVSPRRNRDNVSTVLRPSVNRSISTRDPRLNCLDYKSKPLDLPVKFNDRTSLRNLNISSLQRLRFVSFSTKLIKFSSTFQPTDRWFIYSKDAERGRFLTEVEKNTARRRRRRIIFDEEGKASERTYVISIRGEGRSLKCNVFNEPLTFFVGAALDLRGFRRSRWFWNF